MSEREESTNENEEICGEDPYVELKFKTSSYQLIHYKLTEVPIKKSIQVKGDCVFSISSDKGEKVIGHIDTNQWGPSSGQKKSSGGAKNSAVSYTHLTLPTKA